MIRKVLIAAVLVVSALATVPATNAAVPVRGYYKSNGTYVQPHYRSNADGNFSNNWSTSPNVNPYTVRTGTRITPPPSASRPAVSTSPAPSTRPAPVAPSRGWWSWIW